MADLQLFFAMHDVTPFHQARLERAEALFARWGIEKVLYLLVPNYHAAHRADDDAGFRQWCARPRPFAVEWFLHGYFHRRATVAATVDAIEFDSRLLGISRENPIASPTADEGEFSRLSAAENRDRLQSGLEVFRRCLGFAPTGFVAPKWMANDGVSTELERLKMAWTENDHALFHVPSGRQFRSPVITWATRAWWRKQTSLWGCPILARLCRRAPLLRIALHPFDFDHPAVVDSIARIVERALATHRQAFYRELAVDAGARKAA